MKTTKFQNQKLSILTVSKLLRKLYKSDYCGYFLSSSAIKSFRQHIFFQKNLNQVKFDEFLNFNRKVQTPLLHGNS